MKQRTGAVLLATLASTGAWAQAVNGFSTTIARVSRQDTPGFPAGTLAPVTEFVGLDATGLGSDRLSLHLAGWGFTDLADASSPNGKNGGDLSYGYLQYRFGRANAELKAGRFSVNQGSGVEQVNGVSARTDLRGGLDISGFFGSPVHAPTAPSTAGKPYNYLYQTDVIFGSRLGWRALNLGELGLFFVQEGSKAAGDLPGAPDQDYTRRQLGTDLRFTPTPKVEFTGHSLFNVAPTYQAPGATPPAGARVAEQDYVLHYLWAPNVKVTVDYTEHNLENYYAGTNLPNLFHPDVSDKHRAGGGSILLGPADGSQVGLDFRRTFLQSFGGSDRFGAELRRAVAEQKIKYGAGLHKVVADQALIPGASTPSFYGMSREEARGWVMYQPGKYSASVDAICYHFDDSRNPNLNGKSTLAQVVGSLGLQPTERLSVSGDLSLGTNAYYKNETSVLVRTTYRFSAGGQGGSK